MLLFGTAAILFTLLVVVLGIVTSAMQGIYVSALYTCARTGAVPAVFNKDLIQNLFLPKEAGPGTI